MCILVTYSNANISKTSHKIIKKSRNKGGALKENMTEVQRTPVTVRKLLK